MLSFLRHLLGGPGTSIDVIEAAARMQAGTPLVDVRSTEEWRQCHVPGAIHIPLDATQANGGIALGERGVAPAADGTIMFICHSGMRSGLACRALAAADGLRPVNVSGGMVAWQRAALPTAKGP